MSPYEMQGISGWGPSGPPSYVRSNYSTKSGKGSGGANVMDSLTYFQKLLAKNAGGSAGIGTDASGYLSAANTSSAGAGINALGGSAAAEEAAVGGAEAAAAAAPAAAAAEEAVGAAAGGAGAALGAAY